MKLSQHYIGANFGIRYPEGWISGVDWALGERYTCYRAPFDNTTKFTSNITVTAEDTGSERGVRAFNRTSQVGLRAMFPAIEDIEEHEVVFADRQAIRLNFINPVPPPHGRASSAQVARALSAQVPHGSARGRAIEQFMYMLTSGSTGYVVTGTDSEGSPNMAILESIAATFIIKGNT